LFHSTLKLDQRGELAFRCSAISFCYRNEVI